MVAALFPYSMALGGIGGGLLLAGGVLFIASLLTTAIGLLGTLAAVCVGVIFPITGGVSVGTLGSLLPITGGAFVAPVLAIAAIAGLFSKNPLLRIAAYAGAALAALDFADGCLARLSPALAGAVWWIIACGLPLAFSFARWYTRNLALAHQGNVATIASSLPLATTHIKARSDQSARAGQDTTPFVRLGTARGVFTAKLDPYAPDELLPFGLTIDDLSTHLLVFGATGKLKTTSIMRPVGARYLGWSPEWSAKKAEEREKLKSAGGLVVLDAKGPLTKDFVGVPGYVLIEPGKVALGLIEGLSPSEIVLAFQTVNVPRGSKDSGTSKFFTSSAGIMLFHICVFLEALVGIEKRLEHEHGQKRKWSWTLSDVVAMGARVQGLNEESRQKVGEYKDKVKAHREDAEERGLLNDAITYLTFILPGMDAETRANIWGTLQSWLTPVMQNEHLRPWADVETGFNVDCVFHGGAIGVCTPSSMYGVGGPLIQALVKQRLFAHIRRRGMYEEGWRKETDETVVLILADEAHELVGEEDREILPIARSLGCYCCFATQNVEGYINRLGGVHEAHAFLDNFQSFVAFASSPDTGRWVQARLGQTTSLVPQAGGGHMAYDANLRVASEGALNDRSHEGSRLFRMLARQGAGGTALLHSKARGFGRRGSADDLATDRLALNTSAIVNAEIKVQPLLLDSEWDAYTAEQGCAIAQVQRGGVRRRDVIRTEPMFELPAGFVRNDKGAPKSTPISSEPKSDLPRVDESEVESTAARERTSVAMRPPIPAAPPMPSPASAAAMSMHDAVAEAERTGTFDADDMFGPRPGI
jgi:hypothetical protein